MLTEFAIKFMLSRNTSGKKEFLKYLITDYHKKFLKERDRFTSQKSSLIIFSITDIILNEIARIGYITAKCLHNFYRKE